MKNARLGASANPTKGAWRLVVLCHSGWPAWSTTGQIVSTTSPARDAAEETRPRKKARRQRGRAPYEIVHSPCIFVTTERGLGTFLVLTVPSGSVHSAEAVSTRS